MSKTEIAYKVYLIYEAKLFSLIYFGSYNRTAFIF